MTKKRFLNLLLALCLVLAVLVCLSGCDDKTEPEWHQGTAEPTEDIGAVGDYYYDEVASNVWLKGDDGWTLLTNLKLPEGDAGEDDTDTDDTADKIYIGYLGNIYHGKTDTGVKTNIAEEYVYENTTHIATAQMQEYFEGKYTSASDVVTLMTQYRSTEHSTFYSGMDVERITLASKGTGSVKIGVAKLSDIEAAAKTGKKLTVSGDSYNLTSGINVIDLKYPLNVHVDETIVFTGAELYYTEAFLANDPYGDFTLLSGTADSGVIKSQGAVKSTLAVSVKVKADSVYREVAIDKDVVTQSNGSSVYSNKASLSGAPYTYANKDLYKQKTITKIGIPVVSVSAIDDNQTFTLFIAACNSSSKKVGDTKTRTMELKLPKSELGTDPKNVKKWIYLDLSDRNVHVSSIETLTFGRSTDTVVWGYGAPKTSSNTAYKFIDADDTWSTTPGSANGIFFDVYYKSYITYSEHLAKYEGATSGDTAATKVDIDELKAALKAANKKNLSILGDSISSYNGYSNSTSVNSTLNKNECYFYDGSRETINTVNDTWWMKSINETGLNLVVNNSCSGDQMVKTKDGTPGRPGGINRCTELSNKSGTNPDIIAVYFGTNDRNANVSLSDFESRFNEMIDKIQAKYPNADIFIFTMQDTSYYSVTPDEVYQYNDILYKIAKEQGAEMVVISSPERMNKYNFLGFTIDGEHPNATGMTMIKDAFVEALYKKYVK